MTADSTDAALDAIALTLAVRDGDTEGQAAILANCSGHQVLAAVATLLAAVLDELEVPGGHFRMWSQQEMSRPS